MDESKYNNLNKLKRIDNYDFVKKFKDFNKDHRFCGKIRNFQGKDKKDCTFCGRKTIELDDYDDFYEDKDEYQIIK